MILHTPRRRDFLFWTLLGGAVVVRLAVIVAAGGCRQDPDNYLPIARSLAEGKGYRLNGKLTAYRPPLYPILLAPLTKLSKAWMPWAIGGFHVALGGFTVLAVDSLMRRLPSRSPARYLAVALVAFDPVLVVQSRSVMTETLAAALVATSLWGLGHPGKRGAIWGGVAFGIAGLCRPSLLAGAVLAGLARSRLTSGGTGKKLLDSMLFFTSIAVILFPWALRNKLVLGDAVWTTTHGGYTLALANNAYYYEDVLNGQPGAVWSGENQRTWERGLFRATVLLTEPQADRAIRDGTIYFMVTHLRDTTRASIARLGRFWGITPSGEVYPTPLRILTAAWTVPFWMLVGVGWVFGPRSPDPRRTYAVCVVVGLTCVHAMYWSDMRMRAPIVPALAVIAAGAIPSLRQVWSRFTRKTSRSRPQR